MSRRAFLQTVGLCSAGLALGFAAPAQAMPVQTGVRNLHDESRLLMGTIVRITVARASRDQAEHGMELAFAEMERLIRIFDRHQGETAISALNGQGSLADAPREFLAVLLAAREYNRLTPAFDVTVQPVLDLFASRANPSGSLHVDQKELGAALALVGMEHVRMEDGRISLARAGMGLTLDGIAKGYIVDRAAEALESQGLRNYVINAGGDIRANGEKRPGVAWTVAVEDPAKTGDYPAVLGMRGGALATSGIYERYFDKSRRHNHLIAPATGNSAARLSVTVKAPTAMQADALATALSLMPKEDALRLVGSLQNCACLLVDKDGRIASANWPSLG
jgi:thiamine biosynthesis lipoprotein